MRQIGIEDVRNQLKFLPEKATKVQVDEIQSDLQDALARVKQEATDLKSLLITQQQRSDTRITRVLENAVEKQALLEVLKVQINKIEDQLTASTRRKKLEEGMMKKMLHNETAAPTIEV